MTPTTISLSTLLRQVVAGGDVSWQELKTAVPDPLALGSAERAAWEELSHWTDDGDIRERDPDYAALKREWMRDCLSALKE